MQAKIASVPIESPYWNRVEHGWPFDLQVLRGFLKYFYFFCCEMSGHLLRAASFVNVKITGRGKESLGTIRREIGVSIANF